jgi:glycosyltransferase involved in cell wall biosynthesis
VAGAIFVVAESGTRQQGPVAQLLSTAGWAGAAERVLGQSWLVTPGGLLSPDEARRRGSDPALRSPDRPRLRQRLPGVAKTAARDLLQWRLSRTFDVGADGPWSSAEVDFVWQRHELFQTAGLRLARRLGVPSVLFVPATLMWEAEQWGTTRPGWGRWLERRGERPSLLRADVVACGSDEVVEQVLRLGVPEGRVLLTPSGVDTEAFAEQTDPAPLRRRLGLEGRFVVGWVGSFRRFHALEQAVEAAATVPGTSLLLVGDGPERLRVEQLARHLGVPATFTGTVPHDELPDHLAAMDAAVVLAPPAVPFHYSPLKLGEYMAAGLPVVAPATGQLAQRLTDGVEALVVPPHDAAALAGALRRLQDNPEERSRLGKGARAAAGAGWSWDHQVRRTVEAVRERRDISAA